MGLRCPLSELGGFMKYDGNCGTRAAYSSTRLRYVRCTAMIFDGTTGARNVTADSSTALPSASTICEPSRRPQYTSSSTTQRTRRSEVEDILLDLPVGDVRLVALRLMTL